MFKIISEDRCVLTGYNRVVKGDYEFGIVVIEYREADTDRLAFRKQYQRDEKLATRQWHVSQPGVPTDCFALYDAEFTDLWRSIHGEGVR